MKIFYLIRLSQPRKGLALFCAYVLIGIACLYPAFSSAESVKTEVQKTEINESVFKKWLILNYYKKKIDGKYSSEIINQDYFISLAGRTNPVAEFTAFQNIVKSYVKDGSNKKILCRFPARLTLIANNYEWFTESQRPKCSEYIETNQPQDIKSMSLFFASGYFDNPSSYYGHMLLKFNYGNDITNQSALDSSLNYGADSRDPASSIFYIIKGLFGGYSAAYQRNNHFIHSNNYTNRQIRDIWEYRLNLTPDEIRFIVEHSWELKNASFDYYFFNDNCAHRIARLIELATGRTLSKTSGFWLMPIQVVRNAATDNTTPLISSETYSPSLKKTFSDKYNLLTNKEKKKFIKFLDLQNKEQETFAENLDANNLTLVLEHLDLQVAKQTMTSKDKQKLKLNLIDMDKQRAIVLNQLFKKPIAPIKVSEKYPSYTLLKSRPSSAISAGYRMRQSEEVMMFDYRAANNDFLTPTNPGQEVAKFVMGEIEGEIAEDSLKIKKAVIVDILNINTNPLPRRFTNEHSWGMKIDYAASNNICNECANFGIEGKVGSATRVNENIILYGLAGGRVHTTNNHTYDILSAVSEIGTVVNTSENSIFTFATNYNIDPIYGDSEYIFKANLGINFSKNFDYKMGVENNGTDSVITASIGYYFD